MGSTNEGVEEISLLQSARTIIGLHVNEKVWNLDIGMGYYRTMYLMERGEVIESRFFAKKVRRAYRALRGALNEKLHLVTKIRTIEFFSQAVSLSQAVPIGLSRQWGNLFFY